MSVTLEGDHSLVIVGFVSDTKQKPFFNREGKIKMWKLKR